MMNQSSSATVQVQSCVGSFVVGLGCTPCIAIVISLAHMLAGTVPAAILNARDIVVYISFISMWVVLQRSVSRHHGVLRQRHRVSQFVLETQQAHAQA